MTVNPIGLDYPMKDARDRVVGTMRFTIDHEVEGMAHARVVRSMVPHGTITSIDTAEAAAMPGVIAVVTGADLAADDRIASPFFGIGRKDQPPLAIGKVRYAGEPVAVVVAETERQARAAAETVWPEIDETPFATDHLEASRPGAPVVHDDWPDNACGAFRLHRGDPDAAFATAHRVYEMTYTTPSANPVPLEPHVGVAHWEDGRLTMWSSTQWPHVVRNELANIFGLEREAVRVIAFPLGGGFGAKGQVKMEPLIACAALVAGRPVRLQLDRDEVFFTVAKHAATMRFRTGVDADGQMIAREIELHYDAGAYANTTPGGMGNAVVRSPGPYRSPNIHITANGWYTNTVPTGSYRGALTTQVAFAYESHLDEIAHDLGIDPVELRRRNLLHDGDEYATGESMHDVHFAELLDDVANAIGWGESAAADGDPPHIRRGRGVAVILKSTPTPSRSEARIACRADGTITAYSSGVDMGQGLSTTIAQLAASALGVHPDVVDVVDPDTDITPYDAMTAGSRLTHAAGIALGHAATDLLAALAELAADQMEVAVDDVEHVDGAVVVRGAPAMRTSWGQVLADAGVAELARDGVFQSEGGAFAEPMDVKGVASVHWHQGAVAAEVAVDIETGKVTVERCHGAAFAGRVVNPTRARQQSEGSIIMGLGPTLFEEYLLDNGQLVNPNLSDYMIPSVLDVPVALTSHNMEHVDRANNEIHGVGEMTIPAVAPAVANAVFDAVGVRIRDLPLRAERVLRALDAQETTDG
ncbi:MAG: xanthine dehydrogenase family protein molybdopterin-binding subunit [Nitriliruptoraceae bacterium]